MFSFTSKGLKTSLQLILPLLLFVAGSLSSFGQSSTRFNDGYLTVFRQSAAVPGYSSVSITGNTSSGSSTISNLSSTTNLIVGMLVTGTGIPSGSYITSINAAASSMVISNNASTVTTGLAITVGSAALATTGSWSNGSNSITGINSTSNMFVGMAVSGINIPANTTIASIVSSNAITISSNATGAGTALTVGAAGNLRMTGNTTNGSSTISSISSTANLQVGMAVFGTNIPANTIISAIPSSTSINLNQNATGTTSGGTLFFSSSFIISGTTSATASPNITVSAAAANMVKAGMSVSGTNMPTTGAILSASGTTITLNANANATAATNNILVNAANQTTGTAIFLDEYNYTGVQATPNYTITFPTSGVSGIVAGATTTLNGAVSRSENGRYVIVPAFSTNTGGAAVGALNTTNVLCAVRPISGDGTIGTGLTSSSNWFTAANDFRGATTDDGSRYWMTGGTLGIRTTTDGSTLTTVSSTSTNTRAIGIQNGQLYYSTGSGTNGVYQVGFGKPTATSTTSTITATATAAVGFAVSPDFLTIYTNSSASQISRYTYSGSYNTTTGLYSGGTWSAASTGFTLTGVTGLAVDWTGYTNGTFSSGSWSAVTTGANGAVVYACSPTLLVKGSDNGTGAITTTTLSTLTGLQTFKQLAFSPIQQTVAKGNNSPNPSILLRGNNDQPLFQFSLTANEGNSVMKSVIINQSGTSYIGTSTNDVRNFRLIDDANGNGVFDNGETNLGTGTVTGSNIRFSISSPSYYTQGTTKNFLVIGDVISSATTGNTIILGIASTNTIGSTNYTTNLVNMSGSYVTIGSVAPTGNSIQVVSTYPAPTITTNPQNAIYCQNSTANALSVVATAGSGATITGYQWYSNNVNNNTSGSLISGATSSSYTPPTSGTTTVYYYCVVTNSYNQSTTSNTAQIDISTQVTPSVTISPASSTSICSGQNASFSIASSNNGGTTPTYQWQVNGSNVGTNSNANTTFSYTASNNDQVAVIMTSNNSCASPTTATSAVTTVTVLASLTPSVSINQPTTSTVCSGNTINFTATPTNGGTSPTYQWFKNGSSISGATSSTYSTSAIANNDNFYVRMTSNYACITGGSNPFQSGTSTFTVNTKPTLSAITATSGAVNVNQPANFTVSLATSTTSPYTYQWTVNGVNAGTNSTSFNSSSLSSSAGTIPVSVTVTDANNCTATATQNIIVNADMAFVSGNIVVERVGEGTVDATSAAGKVFLDQYQPNGTSAATLIGSVHMPWSIGMIPTGPSSGVNNYGLTTSANATSEGYITLSSDGSKLIVPGYNVAYNTASVAATTISSSNNPPKANYRTVGIVAADGRPNVPIAANMLSGNNIRSCASDGTQVWANGASGFFYFSTNTDTAAKQYAAVNMRALQIFNGKLYVSSATSPYVGINALGSIANLGDNGSASQQLQAPSPSGGSPYGFVFNPTGDALYVADDNGTVGGVQKFTTTDGINYTYQYNVLANSTLARGLIGDFSGSTPVFYATTTAAKGNTIVRFTDNGSSASTPTTIATAPALTVFKGLAWAPSNNQNGYLYVNTAYRGNTFNGNFGSSNIGVSVTNSGANYFAIAGKFISNPVVITPDAGFEVSLTSTFSTVYTNSNPLTISASTFAETSTNSVQLIYVRFKPNAGGSFTSNITISSTGTTSKSVSVTGTGIQAAVFYYKGTGNIDVASNYTDAVSLVGGNAPSSMSLTNTTYVLQNGSSANLGTNNTSITLGAGSSLQIGGTNAFSLRVFSTGNISGGLGITLAGNGTLIWDPLTSSPTFYSINSGSTFTLFGNGNQNVPVANYSNLSLSGTGIKTFLSNSTYSITGSLNVGSSVSTTGSTIIFNASSGSQTIPGITYNNLTLSTSGGATLTGNATVNGTLYVEEGTFNIATGATLTQLGSTIALNNNTNLSVSGTLSNAGTTAATFTQATGSTISFNSGSTYNHAANGGNIPTATWNANSTVLVTGITSTAPNGLTQTFGNFTWRNKNQTVAVAVNSSNFNVNNALTIDSTGSSTFSLATLNNTYNHSFGSLNVNNNSQFNAVIRTSSLAPVVNINVLGNINVTGTATVNLVAGGSSATLSSVSSSANITLTGDLTVGSTATFYANNTGSGFNHGKVTFNKNGIQTVNHIGTNGRVDYVVGSSTSLYLAGNLNTRSTSTTEYDLVTLNGNIFLNGFTLSAAAINGSGLINSTNASSIAITGNVASTLNFNSSNNSINNVTINTTSSTITLGTSLNLVGGLKVTSGTFNTVNRLTLKSTSLVNTAYVDVVGSTGSITGNAIVERFIPKGFRAYRDIAPQVYNSGSVWSNWQESGTTSNYGVYITGVKGLSGGNDATTGLDYTATASPSLYTYTGTAGWNAVTNTKSTNLNAFQGYRLFVRGARNFNISQTGTNMVTDATLRATGQLVTGDVTYSTTGVTNAATSGSNAFALSSGVGNYSLIANPYACPIDFKAIGGIANNNNPAPSDWTATGIAASYYLLDPSSYNATTGFVTYTTYNAIADVTTPGSSYTSNMNRYIQQGQAVWIQNAVANPTLTISESHKAPTSTRTQTFGSNAPKSKFDIILKQNNQAVDGAVAVFNNNFGSNIGLEDSKKFMNGGANVYINSNNTDLSIEGRPMPSVQDVIELRLSQLTANTTYELQVDGSQFNGQGVQAYILDRSNNSETAIGTSTGVISFNSGAQGNTANTSRFAIVFKPSTTLSTRYVQVQAVKTTRGNVVSWQTAEEKDMTSYVVERSVNGKDFTGITKSTIQAQGQATNNYSYTDAEATTANTYYRIVGVEKAGTKVISKVVLVQGEEQVSSIRVNPNPVQGRSFTVQTSQVKGGEYTLAMYSKAGQLVYSSKVQISGSNGVSTVQVTMDKALSAGTYSLKLIGTNLTAEVLVK